MRNLIFSLLFGVLFCGSCKKEKDCFENALRLAGDNRPELEKKSALLCTKTVNKYGGK